MGQQYSHLSSGERILVEKLHCEQRLSMRETAVFRQINLRVVTS